MVAVTVTVAIAFLAVQAAAFECPVVGNFTSFPCVNANDCPFSEMCYQGNCCPKKEIPTTTTSTTTTTAPPPTTVLVTLPPPTKCPNGGSGFPCTEDKNCPAMFCFTNGYPKGICCKTLPVTTTTTTAIPTTTTTTTTTSTTTTTTPVPVTTTAVSTTTKPIDTSNFCPYGFDYSATTDRCYYVSNTCQKYDDAQADCVSKKSNLTSIRDKIENYVVWDIAQLDVPKTENEYWIGARVADIVPPAYAWVNGDDFEFHRLHDPFDCMLKTCVAGLVERDSWVPLQCNECHYYVCEKAPKRPTCPNRYTYFPDTDSCYKLLSTAAPFSDQELNCIDDGGHLTSIHSDDENDFVYTLAGNVKTFWSGARAKTYPTYLWRDGTPFDYTNWASGRPAGGQCISVQGSGTTDVTQHGKWLDGSCGQELTGVCKARAITEAEFFSNDYPEVFDF